MQSTSPQHWSLTFSLGMQRFHLVVWEDRAVSMQPRSPEDSHQRRHQAAPKRCIPAIRACSAQSSIMQALHHAIVFEMLMSQCNKEHRKGFRRAEGCLDIYLLPVNELARLQGR